MTNPVLRSAAEGQATPLAPVIRRDRPRRRDRAAARRGGGSGRAVGLLLVAPMLLFTLVLFGLPLVQSIWASVADPEVRGGLPEVARCLATWDGRDLPPDGAFAALARDLAEAQRNRAIVGVATRLNYEKTGLRTVVSQTGQRLVRLPPPASDEQARALLASINPAWTDPATWTALRRSAQVLTPYYLLAALDLRQDLGGTIRPAEPDKAIFLDVIGRTLGMSLVATAAALLLGFPVAYLLATASPRWRGYLLIPVVLPFWVSLVARLCAWVVILQREGIINSTLVSLHVLAEPLQLLFTRTGVYLGMIHLLLPFMVLPLYSVLQTIPPSLMRAAVSLGATPPRALLNVYLPQALPGIGAGCSLAFIISLGFYLTQALLGGPRDTMLSYYVAFYALQVGNRGMAAALSLLLILVTMIIYAASRLLFGAKARPV